MIYLSSEAVSGPVRVSFSLRKLSKNSKDKRFGTADHPCELFGCSSKSYLRFAILVYLTHICEISAYSGTVLNRSVLKCSGISNKCIQNVGVFVART